jgi:hypothetical protein
MGLGQITFDHLRRAALRSRGMGQVSAPPSGIAVGSPCYDPAHDGGEIHCASWANVIQSAFNPFSTPMTTTCSDAETACLNGGAAPVGSTVTAAQAAILNASATSTDPCAGFIGMSCMSMALIAGAIVLGLAFLKGGRR